MNKHEGSGGRNQDSMLVNHSVDRGAGRHDSICHSPRRILLQMLYFSARPGRGGNPADENKGLGEWARVAMTEWRLAWRVQYQSRLSHITDQHKN
jgi:hypothetical protein